jgi:dipeptidyl aminopeptidase/acylaminoacyl peptidase
LPPAIFPDYADIKIPPNIAPLRFRFADEKLSAGDAVAIFTVGDRQTSVSASRGHFNIGQRAWRRLLRDAAGKTISVAIEHATDSGRVRYAPLHIYVADEPIDPYLVYRLISPGYESWYSMGIFQRNLENFDESAIITNAGLKNNCMNCHSFMLGQPDKMVFHIRKTYAGTMLVSDGKIEKLNTKTPQTMSPLVYPAWHPSGKFIAFSVNNTAQVFHSSNANRIEVFDFASDVVVYDVDNQQVMTSPLLSLPSAFETFPAFSPDGRTLYFCSADSVAMPQRYADVHNRLCAIDFDPATRQFGATVDTVFDAAALGLSATLPRVSPDGQYLMFTLATYGNFHIWHNDADLRLLRLRDRRLLPVDTLNSTRVESYHSWSANSRWTAYSTRRLDGLYTRPMIAYISADGVPAKPFLVPQKDADFYMRLMKSYNIPELVKGKVNTSQYQLVKVARESKGTDVRFKGN